MTPTQEQRVGELAAALDGKPEPAPEAETPDQSAATPETEAGTEAPEQEAPDTDEFYEFDVSSVPEDADREWLAKRHREMQAAFTKKTQTVAEQRREAEQALEALNDPEQRLALLRAWGYDLEDPSDDDEEFEEYEEPTAEDFRSTKEWQEFQQFQQRLQEAAQQEQEETEFRSAVSELETREGREIDDTEWELLWNLSQAGVPVDAGFDRISQLRKAERVAHTKSKQAPQVPKAGKSATQVPDLSDERARVDFLAEQIEANRQD